MAVEDDADARSRRWLHGDRRVRPILGDHCLAGKSPEGSRQPVGGKAAVLPLPRANYGLAFRKARL
jgi:hypothetical protein